MNMRRIGKDLGNFPFIMQWNKRDMPSALPVGVLDRYLNRRRAPSFEAVAFQGKGVFAMLRAICKNGMRQLYGISMRIFGLDFPSTPRRKKPITCAVAE